MSAMNFHHLEPGRFGAPRGLAKVLHELMNLGDGQLLRNGGLPVPLIHQRPRVGRGGFHGRPQKTLAAAMLNLDAGHAVVVFDGVRQPAQADHKLIVADAQLIGRGFAEFPVHIGILHDDHAHLALGQVFVAAHQTLRHSAVHVAQAGGLRRLADAVFDFHVADFAGAEQGWKLIAHDAYTPFAIYYSTHPGDMPMFWESILSIILMAQGQKTAPEIVSRDTISGAGQAGVCG